MTGFGARRSLLIAAASVALALVAGPSTASALTIGQIDPADPDPDSCNSAFDLLQPSVTSGPSYVVPSTGGVASWTVTSWSTKTSVPGQSMALKIFRKVGDPDVYRAIAHEGPHTLVAGLNTFSAHLSVKPGDVLGAHSTAGPCVFPVPGESILFLSDVDLADGAQDSFQSDTNFRLNASAQVEPTSDFTLKKPKSKANGTAVLPVTVPNPGVLTVSGGGAAKTSAGAVAAKQVTAPGTVKLTIRAKGLKKRKLARKGKVTVKPKITFTPTGGIPNSAFRKIKLRHKH
jgi:hypothetical protein